MEVQNDQKISITDPMLSLQPGVVRRKRGRIIGQVLAAATASLASMSSGTTLSWTSACLTHHDNLNSTSSFHIDAEQGSWIGSLLAVGALLSAIPSGYCVDIFGRKNSILSLFFPFTISWILIIKATNIWMMYFGRIFAGMGIGGICVMAPMYLTEITEELTRGTLCSLFPLFFCIGILFTFIVGLWAEYTLLSYILAIVPVVFGVSFLFMPESPVYLIKNGRDKEAKEALRFLRGSSYDINSEITDIKKEVFKNMSKTANLIEIFRDDIYFRSTLACIILFIFQQMSGINAVVFYTVPIFKASNSSIDPMLSSIVVALVQVLVTILVMFVVDKLGRKTYLIHSAIVMAVCLFFLGLYFNLKIYEIDFFLLDLLPLVSLMIFIFSFSIGFGPIPWIVLGEMLTPEIVGTVSGLSMVANWVMGFVVTKSFAPMLVTLGAHWTFYCYACFNVMAAILVSIFVPETRFKLQHEIFDTKK